MALLDDLQAALNPERRCKLFHLGLPDDELQAVLLYVEKIREDQNREVPSRLFTNSALRDLLLDNGYSIGKTVISEHVRKVCCCDR